LTSDVSVTLNPVISWKACDSSSHGPRGRRRVFTLRRILFTHIN
jgi:hypothetical protein